MVSGPAVQLFCLHPHTGGTNTVFRSLHAALALLGDELLLFNEASHPPSADRSEPAAARRCLERIAALNPAVVYLNILSSPFLTNLCRYIPASIPVVALVHNITPGTYRPALAYRPWLSHYVAVSPRIAADLQRRDRRLAGRITVIPTGLPPAWFEAPPAASLPPPRSFLFVGRFDAAAKGTAKLAEAFRRPALAGSQLTLVGDGPDRAALERSLADSPAAVRFLGSLDATAVAAELRRHRHLLTPSNYEGQLLANLEAMACGCVPITSAIHGVTDTYIQSGRNGFLIDPRGSRPLGRAIEQALTLSDEQWLQLSRQARADALAHHGLAPMASAYAALRHSTLPVCGREALDLDHHGWSYPPAIARSAGLRRLLPAPLKGWLRQQLAVR